MAAKPKFAFESKLSCGDTLRSNGYGHATPADIEQAHKSVVLHHHSPYHWCHIVESGVVTHA
jgi:hypothetical protein